MMNGGFRLRNFLRRRPYRTGLTEKLPYPLKHLMPGSVTIHVKDILLLLDLADLLLKPCIFVDRQPDAAGLAVTHRHAQDALDVVGAAGKQADDMRHHAGVVVDR